MVVTNAALLHEEDAIPDGVRPALTLVPSPDQQRYDSVEACVPGLGTMLAQNRQHYDPDKIASLADSLRRQGLINPPEVAALTASEARAYLRVWNKVWGRRYALSHLDRRDDLYLIVVNGHCRKLAGLKVHKEDGRAPANWRVKLLYGITAEEALDRQFQENIHTTPETWEDAEAVYRYWMFLTRGKGRQADVSVAEFAAKVGRSESAVRDYIKFGDAPEMVQVAVRSNRISYGKGLLIARAVELGVLTRDEQVESNIDLASLPGQTNGAFEKSLNARIAQASQRQGDLWGEMDVETVVKALEDERRAVVLPELLRRVRENGSFFGAALDLAHAGKLGPERIYSGASVGRALLEEAQLLQQLLPHLREEVAAKRLAEAEATIDEACELLTELHAEPSPPQELSLLAA